MRSGLPGSGVIWASTQQHRRDIDRALLLASLDHLWGFPKFKVLDPYHIYLFTIAMARTSTSGMTRKGVRGTEGCTVEYCPFTGIKLSARCAGTQAHCRGCFHMTTQHPLLFARYDLIQRSWISGKSELQCQVTKISCNKCVTRSSFNPTPFPCKPVAWDLLLLICYCK